ncbi:hypothetical protein QFZ82_006582 [Streptomyces sp. V4I23]|nr:hypothetical protein [Streptomyces sp. V4I23]
MQPGPHPGLGPLGQPPPSGHAGPEAEFLWQVFPEDPGVQHEQDALEHQPVRMPFASRMPGPTLDLGQQRFDHRPQLVVDFPRLRPSHSAPQDQRSQSDPTTYACGRRDHPNSGLGLGQLAVPVHQTGVPLVEDSAVAVNPQGGDVVAGRGLDAVVQTVRRDAPGTGSEGMGECSSRHRRWCCEGPRAGRGRPSIVEGSGAGFGRGPWVASCGDRERAAWVRALNGRRAIPRRCPTVS